MKKRPDKGSCASRDRLRRYHAGELPDGEHESIEGHLESCGACRALAETLRSEHEAWIDRIRGVGVPPPMERRVVAPLETGAGAVAGYEILEEIGRGGQGIVYRARQVSTKRDVAIKVLREGPGASARERRRFEREIELAALLRHRNIVTVFDSGTTADGRSFVVMDLIEGRSLDQYVGEESPGIRRRLELFSGVCRAVHHAHQRGTIHRDLKPSNVIVDRDGEARVLDFGLARSVQSDGRSLVTETGSVAGTLAYMSPEQVRGDAEGVDVRSDVYTLGVILHEMLTRRHPHPVDGDLLKVARHIAETAPDPIRLGEVLPGGVAVDDELETIVLRALAKDRDRRYQSAADLAGDIGRYLRGDPIEAKRDSRWYLVRKGLARHRVAAGLAGALVVALMASAVALGVMYVRQSRLRAEAQVQAALAERRFDQVRDLANTFIVDVDPLIKRLQGSAPARELIVSKGLEYLDALGAEPSAGPALRRDIAAGYAAIGAVQGDTSTSNLGDLAGAVSSYRRARSVYEALLAQDPDDLQAARQIGILSLRIGPNLASMGDPGARAEYERGLEVAEELAAAHPENRRLKRDLCVALDYAYETVAAGDPVRAEGFYLRGMAIAEELAREDPDDHWAKRDVAVGHMNLARMMLGRGEREEAMEHFGAFRDLSEELLDFAPGDLIARRDVLAANQWMGIALLEGGDAEASLESLRACAEHAEGFLADAPDEALRREGIICYTRLGEAQMAMGDLEAARETFERLVELASAQAREMPRHLQSRRLEGVALYKMSEYHKAVGGDAAIPVDDRIAHWREARGWLERCLRCFERMERDGVLSPGDEGTAEALAGEVEACDREIEGFQSSG